ncbi:MAG TPA: DUF423 domain-containing protein [Anaerolineae bacterium]|nr:DUF423 domain-containing protein [Anaerolineae bacterium]
MARRFFRLAALLGALAVAAGAFAAHGLKPRLDPAMLANWETAARYQFYHVFALMAAAWLLDRSPDCKSARGAGWLFLAGMVLFSGSLYAMALTGLRGLGMITPFGGVAFITGWVFLALAARRL